MLQNCSETLLSFPISQSHSAARVWGHQDSAPLPSTRICTLATQSTMLSGSCRHLFLGRPRGQVQGQGSSPSSPRLLEGCPRLSQLLMAPGTPSQMAVPAVPASFCWPSLWSLVRTPVPGPRAHANPECTHVQTPFPKGCIHGSGSGTYLWRMGANMHPLQQPGLRSALQRGQAQCGPGRGWVPLLLSSQDPLRHT